MTNINGYNIYLNGRDYCHINDFHLADIFAHDVSLMRESAVVNADTGEVHRVYVNRKSTYTSKALSE